MNPLGFLYSFEFVLLLACAAFYYKAAEIEDSYPVLWAALSILIFLITWLVFHWGLLGCLGGQLLYLAAITLLNVLRSIRK